jgi:preprotein translocase SecE subunit
MPILSLVGVVYILISLVLVFGGIPALMGILFSQQALKDYAFAVGALQIALMVVGCVALGYVGTQLQGQRTIPGLRAGIFVGLLLLLVVVGLTRWVSLWLEYWLYYQRWMVSNGATAWTVGASITAVAGAVFLIAGLRWFLQPSTEKMLVAFEEQGWFSTTTYKRQQGQRVRRATILGLLILVGSGVVSLLTHKTLERGPTDWAVYIPFTGKTTIDAEYAGDALNPVTHSLSDTWASWSKKVLAWEQSAPKEGKEAGDMPAPVVMDRYILRDINDKVDPKLFVKIDVGEHHLEEFNPDFQPGAIIPKSDFENLERKYKQQYPGSGKLDVVAPQQAWGETSFARIVLLPHVRYTVPLLLLALALWVSWRIVNLPTFSDFLIATEAEMNKVSWTTRRRLYQDTIVVLSTMLLMAGYLFLVDQVWSHLLSWRPVGVIVMNNEESTTTTKAGDRKPW